MMDLFLSMGLSNACFALALALVALVAGAKARRPHLAHLLWLLVLVRLITPPLVTIPVDVFARQMDQAGADHRAFVAGAPSALADTAPGSPLRSRIAPVWHRVKPCLAALWLLGSAVVLVWSMAGVCRFGRLLARESDPAPPELQREAEKIARRLGLATGPTICTTSAHLSPLVWWAGGRVRIVIPKALLNRMDAQDWQWILAHELAHVRRRDHLVRWVEWLACVGFWWNPVVWWAQRNLRALEEICCDDLVLSSLHPQPRSYAGSLLSAVEFFARPAVRAPALASEINSGGSLERRFKMIVASKPNRSSSRWLRMGILACALVVLPLGLASAQDYDAVAKRLKEAVKQGEITPPQAEAMMAALKKEAAAKDGKEKVTPKEDSRDKKVIKKDQDVDEAMAYLTKVKKDLGAAVEAGKISKEDALEKYAATARALKAKTAAKKDLKAPLVVKKVIKDKPVVKKDRDPDKTTTGPTKVKKDPAAAVKTDKISKKDPAKKPEAATTSKKDAAKPDDDTIARELKAAVEAGKLTKEEAKAKWEAIQKEAAQDKDGK